MVGVKPRTKPLKPLLGLLPVGLVALRPARRIEGRNGRLGTFDTPLCATSFTTQQNRSSQEREIARRMTEQHLFTDTKGETPVEP